MAFQLLEFTSHNSVALLTFSSDQDYPRLTTRALKELAGLLARIREERLFRGVVIAANQRSFATGAAIHEIVGLEGVGAYEFALEGQSLFNAIARFPLPVVAAIRGYCLGGALDLALACHVRVATFDSSFGHPGASLGLLTGWGGTQQLPRRVGRGQALQTLLTGDRIPATQALTMGLVNDLVAPEDLIDAAAQLAERIASGPAFNERRWPLSRQR